MRQASDTYYDYDMVLFSTIKAADTTIFQSEM